MTKKMGTEVDRRVVLERAVAGGMMGALFGGLGLADLQAAAVQGTAAFPGLEMKQGVRRIITGHNAQGRSYIIKDDRITTGPFPSLYKATGEMPLGPGPAGEPQKIMPTDAPQLEPALGGSS